MYCKIKGKLENIMRKDIVQELDKMFGFRIDEKPTCSCLGKDKVVFVFGLIRIGPHQVLRKGYFPHKVFRFIFLSN